ncbi:unnamed protein product [Brugia pahangi]|uniref:Transposase n=1 Tax=Brugia pahangi TaxID=6280 RepID=A0A0N4T5M9_BRUPA|nr:unnamed protein product [Brugia pahangi]
MELYWLRNELARMESHSLRNGLVNKVWSYIAYVTDLARMELRSLHNGLARMELHWLRNGLAKYGVTLPT